jgi:hypothetical protein
MKFIDKYFSHIMTIILMTIIMFAGIWLVKRNQPPHVVKVDLVAITSHYTQMMAVDTFTNKDVTNIDNPAVKRISDAIKNNLEPLISDYAKKNNVIVLQAQAFVGGDVIDITPVIINELDKKIK